MKALPRPILSLLREFLANKDVRANSRALYKRTIELFINWMVTSGVDVTTPTRADVINYKAYLIAHNHPPSTVDSYLTSVRQFFAWLSEDGIYPNVAAGVKSPYKHRGFSKGHLTAKEVEKLVYSIPTDTLIGLRDRAAVSLMVTMGPRACEICRLERDDMLRNNAGMKLKILGKRRYDKRVVGMVPTYVVQMIDTYIDNRQDDATYLFATHKLGQEVGEMSTESLSRIVRNYLKRANLKRDNISTHSLRHTAAVNALKNGATIEQVMAMLGHRDINTTMIYQSSMRDDEAANSTAVRCAASAYDISA